MRKTEKIRREKTLENALVDEVRKAGGLARKYFNKDDTGWPDRDVLLPTGKQWFVEVKKPTGKLSPLQIIRRDWLIANGFNYLYLDSWETLDNFKKQHLIHAI